MDQQLAHRVNPGYHLPRESAPRGQRHESALPALRGQAFSEGIEKKRTLG